MTTLRYYTSVLLSALLIWVSIAPPVGDAAIAFDSETDSAITAASLTYSHTIAGSNTILVVAGWSQGANMVATYAGTKMTQSAQSPFVTDGNSYIWYLIAPTTGANNVVITASSSVTLRSVAMSYTGAAQSGQPDTATSSDKSATLQNSATTTTITNNDWLVMGFREDVNGDCHAGNNTTVRGAGANSFCGFDSNGAKSPAGSYALVATTGPSTSRITLMMLSIAPAAAAASTPTPDDDTILFQ